MGKLGRKGAQKRKRLEGWREGGKEGDTGTRIDWEIEVTVDKTRGRRETEERRGHTRTFVQRHAWCLECLDELEDRYSHLPLVHLLMSTKTCHTTD